MRRIALAAALALLPSLAFGQAVTYADRSGTIAAGGTAQVLMPVSPQRRGCIVQNQSATDLWVSSAGTAAAAPPSFRLPAGAQYVCMAPAPSNVLSIFGATSAAAFAASEW